MRLIPCTGHLQARHRPRESLIVWGHATPFWALARDKPETGS
jgi:hypothetical protein